MDDPTRQLCRDGKPTDSQLESQDQKDYGTVKAPGQEENGSTFGEPPVPAGQLQAPEDPAIIEARRSVKRAFPILAIGVLLAAVDTSIVAANYAIIGSELGALNLVSWIVTAYFLTAAASQILYGKFSDVFGRKSCLLFSYTCFVLGVVMCGLAQSMQFLIAARALQGIGGGGMVTLVSVILSDVIPLKDRGAWQGYLNIFYSVGMSIGAPLGGVLTEFIGWRWVFIGQAPIALVTTLAIVFMLRLPISHNSKSPSGLSKLWQIDYLGGILIIGSITSFLLGLDFGTNHSWSALACIVPLASSPILLVSFLLVETKVASNPFIPGYILFNKPVFAVYSWNFFTTSGWFCFFFSLPLFYQAVLQLNAAQAGLLLLPAVAAYAYGNFVGGLYLKRTGKYYWAAIFSIAGAAVGFIPAIISAKFHSIVGITMGTIVVGYSRGFNMPLRMVALINSVPKADQAIATACFYVFTQLGSAVGASIGGIIIQSVLRARLSNISIGEGISHARDNLDFIKKLAPEVQEIVRGIYSSAIRYSFIFAMSNLVLAVLCVIGIREKPL